jgi:integrase
MATKKTSLALPATKARKKAKRKLPVGVVEKEGHWYVRARYREFPGGPRHAAWRECAKNATAAKEVRQTLKKELEENGPESLLHNRDTWGALADYYRDHVLIPAQYLSGKKVDGRRSWKVARYQLKTLRSLIPDSTKLRQMDYELCRQLRLRLINLPVTMQVWAPAKVFRRGKEVEVKRGKKIETTRQRSMIDVNRHMEILRHMLKVARKRLRWIRHDPFADAPEPLVTRADEKKRRRVMSFDEEAALLMHCIDEREQVRIVMIGLVDSMMRPGEFFKQCGRDLAFELQQVTVQQMNTKTLSERTAPMTARYGRELKKWFETHDVGPDDRVFSFDSVRRSWSTLKRLAGVTDLRLKDLRRTGATRLLRAGHPMEEISHLLGHTSVDMTYAYIGIDKDTTGRAVAILDAMHEARENAETVH